MSLHSQLDYRIPEETRRVTHAAFPAGHLCLRIADELGNERFTFGCNPFQGSTFHLSFTVT